ncbi:HalOD1 output domain-containing protein [Natrinema gelatinilyticum]|uniref:HalOD1 output domain-containing protein n=1 Tax=Natrinema gelatinilyticum TaxID=2961571 RepID=UPI0020C4C17A|nr:HalOD1 output domain-containing protein [Natrinema gelatinilyticum]
MTGDNKTVPVSNRVVEAVATEIEKEPTELEPLYHSIDPEILNKAFPVTTEAASNPVRQFTFSYEDRVVNVSHDGSVEVFPNGGTIPDLSPTDSTSSSREGSPEAPD